MSFVFMLLLFQTKSKVTKKIYGIGNLGKDKILLNDKKPIKIRQKIPKEEIPQKVIGKPLNTMTPKPSFTRFSKQVAQLQDSADLPMPFPKDEEASESLKEEIKKQLVSTPMLVFYATLAVCVVIACGLFMFCSETDESDDKFLEEQQQAAFEEQLNETLDPQLQNEAPLQI